MNQPVSNQNIVFIQSKSPQMSKLFNEFVQDKGTPQHTQNMDEKRNSEINFVHSIRQFPQSTGYGVQALNQLPKIDSEAAETPSHLIEEKIEIQQRVSKFNQFKQRSLMKQPTSFRKEENEEKEEEEPVDDQPNQDVNLKYGDIIYFKFYKDQSKGIISGDGIAGNKLECISIGNIISSGSEEHFNHEQDLYDFDEQQAYVNPNDDPNMANKQILNKRASLQFRKCLFRVTNSKKYYYQNLYNNELKNNKSSGRTKNQQQKLSDIEQKMREEQEENERAYTQKRGTNVIYGQEIQLEHIYSKCVVTLNPDVLAYEHCCRELSLEEIPSSWSNFIVNSANNAKKTGEPVMYKEQLSIYSSENPYYWINIQQSQSIQTGDDNEAPIVNIFDEGLEVNCTDRSVPLKLNLYLGITEEQERETQYNQSENKAIQIGDIVYLYNRIVKGRIGVQRKSQTDSNESSQFQMKRVEILMESNDDFQQKKSLPIQVLKVEDYTKNISQQYELFVDTEEEENRIETLWEIQRVKNFDSSMAQHDENIRIKNVWTGLYIYLNDDDEVSLTLEGNLDKTFFHVKPKRVVQLVESGMLYQQPVKILQQLHDRTMYLRVKEDPFEEDEFTQKHYKKKMKNKNAFSRDLCRTIDEKNQTEQAPTPKPVNSISSYHIKKDKRGEIEFELVKADTRLINLADRVSSLFPYLMNFYVFLLQWGNKITKRDGIEEWNYDYHIAFDQQKYLYNYVQQLYQSIENLNDFLKQDPELAQRQKILLDAGIVEIILLILKLIHYKIYCHCELEPQNKEQRLVDFKTIPDKTAQKIASIKLLKTINVLYDILIKCIQGNSETSSFVLKMQKDNFLFNQIRYHKQEVVLLLKEATRYIDGDQKEQNIENMRKWVKKILQINFNNIQEQTFVIELLCLSITDHLEQPIIDYQNALRKLLFSRPKNVKDDEELYYKETQNTKDKKYTGYFRKPILISFKMEYDQPYIIFNLSNDYQIKSKFEDENPDLYITTGKNKASVRDDANVNHFPFDHINGAMAKGKSNQGPQSMLEKYEVYVLEVLNLYALLSAGRNHKSIKCLQSIGLTKNYIYKCLQSKKIDNHHLRQYRSILNLYDSFILNVPPFIPISSYHNLVFQNIDFKDFNPKEQPSYALFREIVVNQETKNQIREEYQKLTEHSSQNQEANESKLLQLYAKLIVEREEQQYKESKNSADQKQAISSLRIQEELIIYDPNEKDKVIDKLNHENIFKMNPNADKVKLSKFMMETFHQMLKITKTRVNLGYNTPEQNQRILDIIPNLFFALIDFKDQMRDISVTADLTELAALAQKKDKLKESLQRFNKNWIYHFILHNLEYSIDDLITTKIFIEAITIVNIINKLNMYLYIVEVIQLKRQEFTNDCLEFFYQFKFSLDDIKQINEKQKETQMPKQRVNLSVLIMQTMEYLRKDPILEQTMFKTLIKNFDYLKDLQNQTIEVEIIEDLQEIEIYKDVNGITENNQNQRSPQDIKQLVFKTIQYFQFFEQLLNDGFFMIKPDGLEDDKVKEYEQKQTKLQDLEKNYDQLNQAIEYCISLFSKKMVMDSAKNKQQHYILQLQNIFRHSRIPEYFIKLLENVPQYNSVFIEFYRKVVDFFYHYTKDNIINKRRLLELIPNIMNLCLIPNDNIINPEKLGDRHQNGPLQPIKRVKIYLNYAKQISKLCIKLLEDIKSDSASIKDIINQIISLIEDNIPFNVDRDRVKGQNWKMMKYKIYRYGVNELKCLALIQYFKILKSLTIAENGSSIQSNQLQILNNFMHKKMLSDIVQPIIESYLTKFGIKFETEGEYLKLKLHSQDNNVQIIYLAIKKEYLGIILLSQCCKDFKIGIQEIQRFVMFDTLKAIVVSQYSPFILKRAYLKCLFEAYVNKVYDLEKDSSNETISNIELNDILTSEVIPILALSTSYKYLQGLITNKDNRRESENLRSIRDNVRRNKYKLFKSNKEYDKAIWADDQKKADPDSESMQEAGIVKDVSEYWKYLFKEGVIHFIIDSYDEFTDVISNDSKESDHQGSVNSNFQFIGNYLQKLLEQIEIVEKEFKVISIQKRTYVDFELMRNALEIIPIGNPKKIGTHFIIDKTKDQKNQVIQMQMNNQEQQGEMKQEMNVSEIRDSEFIEVQKQFKLQLIRKRIKLIDFMIQFYNNFHEEKSIHKALYHTLNVQKIIYTPSQITYILKKFCNYDISALNKQNINQLGKKRYSNQQYDLEEQIKTVLIELYQFATKSPKHEAIQDGTQEVTIMNNVLKGQKKIRTQQAQIDIVKVQFGRIIRDFIHEQLNILKKSIIDSDIENQLFSAKDQPSKLEQLKNKYSQDIDNCIGDYEIYEKHNEDESDESKPIVIKSKTLLQPSQSVPIINNDGKKESINLVQDEEEELGKIEKTYLDRMMIDSQITLFLRDIQAELNIYGVNLDEDNSNGNYEEDDEDEEGQVYSYSTMNDAINPQRRIFQSYIQLFSSVFSGERIYLVKIVRLILEAVQVNDQTMSYITSTNYKERKRAQAKFDLLQLCQTEIASQEIFIHALKLIKVTSSYDQLQEGLTFMICMLNRGNSSAQNAVLNYLKKDTDALVDFFSFLRNFFNQEISQQIKGMYDHQNVSDIPTEFEILSLKILRLIQLFCENVNENFQLFLMKQSNDEKSLLSNYNVTLEVSTFLSIFLEDDLLSMARKQNIIVQCIDTLNECISGQQKVLECVARNKRLFIYLNEKIIRQKRLNFTPNKILNPNQQEINQYAAKNALFRKGLELFQSAMKFMLTIVSGISNKEDLEFLLEQVQTNKLILILNEIYDLRIRPKQSQILMGQECKHQDKNSGKPFICNDDYCFENNVTPIEQLIISIGFSIFIFFYYIRELFPEDQNKLLAFHLDEKKDLEITLDLSDFGISSSTFTKKKPVPKLPAEGINIENIIPAQIIKSDKKQLMRMFTQAKNHSNINDDQEEESMEKEEQEEQSQKKEEGEEDQYDDDNNERMSARKLLHKGLTYLILKDIANLEKGEMSEEQKQNEASSQKGAKGQMQTEEDADTAELCSDKNREYFKFFKNFVGSVEVKNQHQQIKKVYFQKPFYTKFLTLDIKKHLIYQADRDSDTERLAFLIDHITYYEDQMIHKQFISQWGIFSYVADKWRLYKEISYYLVVALTIITLSTYGQSSENGNDDVVDSTSNEDVKRTFMIVSYIQLALSFAILVSCAIERFPISVYRNVKSQVYETIQKHKKNSGFPDDSLSSIYNQVSNQLYSFFSSKNAKSKTYVKVLLVCFDKENIYNLIYLIVTGFAFQNNLIYAFLLLDIVKRSEDLQNVISSITKNALNLIKFSFLGIVIMYIYGIIGYQSFQSDYESDNGGISNTFILTITSTIKEGLRNGGGVADSMSAVEYSSDQLWSRYFFDLTFFIVINMLFIQIIFGIILDTFGELRDNRSELLQLVRETCYICGLSRRYIEANSEEDWHHHIYMEHNCYNLLFYMIYIKRKSENDCDALEKFIKRCLDQDGSEDIKPVSFIPIGESLSIESFRKEKEPEDNQDKEEEKVD